MDHTAWLAEELKQSLNIWSTTSNMTGSSSSSSDVWAGNGMSWGHLGANGRNNGGLGLGFKIDMPGAVGLDGKVTGSIGGVDFTKDHWNGIDVKLPLSVAGSLDGAANGPLAGIKNTADSSAWGHQPVRQDTIWDDGGISRKVAEPLAPVDKPCDGTEIWRAALLGEQLGGVTVDKSRLNGQNPTWNELERHVVSAENRHPVFSLPPGQVTWDTTGTRMWGDISRMNSPPSLPLPDVLRHLSNSAKFASMNVPSEADFGVWSHSSPPVPSQQQPVDNGTAIWGNPPGVTAAPAPRPTVAPILPFNIDVTQPPPPLPKTPTANVWNPSSQLPKNDVIWPGTDIPKSWMDMKSNNLKGPVLSGVPKSQNAPQMRSRLLQQLMDLGFRKEDAQNAIIRNNMNVDRTLAELLSRQKLAPGSMQNGPGHIIHSANQLENLLQSNALRGNVIGTGHMPTRNPPSPLSIDVAAARMDPAAQRLLLQQLITQQMNIGHQNASREVIAVRVLIADCLQLVTVLRTLYQLRAAQAGRENDAMITAYISQVDEKIREKVYGQLLCLPPASLLVDVKELGYDNGAAAAVDILQQIQELNTLKHNFTSNMNHLTPSPIQNGFPSSAPWNIPTVSKPSTSLASTDVKNLPASTAEAISGKSSVLDIKEFVPGRPWGSLNSTTTVPSPVMGAATVSTSHNTNMGLRRGSLVDIDKSTTVVSSRLSVSEWSLDGTGSGNAKTTVDPAASVPALWSPTERVNANSQTNGIASDANGTAATQPSTLILKNVSDKIDNTTLKNLCAQHGRLKSFVPCTETGHVSVTYAVQADAARAQRALNMCLVGDCHLVAEFQDSGVALTPTFSASVNLDGRGAGAWSAGSYEQNWSLGDEVVDSSFLPAGLLNDSC